MDLLAVIQRLWARKLFVLVAIILAAAAALVTRYHVSSSGHLTLKHTVSSQSKTQVLVDTRYSTLARVSLPTTASSITARTPLFADYAASPPIRQEIATDAGVPVNELLVTAVTTETATPVGAVQSTSYNVAPAPGARNKVVLSASDLLPVITISATSTSAAEAAKLVNSTVSGLRDAIHRLEQSERIRGANRLVLRPLGVGTGSTTIRSPSLAKTVLAGVGALLVLLIVILTFDGLRRRAVQPREATSPA